MYDIVHLLADTGTNEHKRLCLLNALVKLAKRWAESADKNAEKARRLNVALVFTVRELLLVVSTNLCHQFTQVRAAALRTLRHLLQTADDLAHFNQLQLSDLVCRSLDIVLKNDEERVQALKLIRRMLIIDPRMIDPAVVRCLVSLGEGGSENGDRMLRSCLAVLCEFGVLHPKLLICCGGVSAITRNVLECHSPRIAESLCGVLLHLLEWPDTRSIAGVRLDCLAAPYCDFTYRAGIMDKNKDARDLRFTCSRLALLSVLRSWSGVIEFCDPSKASGLKAIVDILYLNQLEVRKAILDLLYELLSIPQPVWTDEFTVALATIDPADFQDAWRLSEGFVAAEGRNILPTLAQTGPNVCEIHTALLLYCFLETGLMDALVEVIVTSDTFISVRATVLLGKLTHLMQRLLPPDICATSAALPALIGYATQNCHQATAAVAALQSFHQILKQRPASCSLFLDCIVRSGNIVKSKLFRREIVVKDACVPLQVNNRHVMNVYRKDVKDPLSNGGGGGGSGGDGSVCSGSNLEVGGIAGGAFMTRLNRPPLAARQRYNSGGSGSVDLSMYTPPDALNASASSSLSNPGRGLSLKRSGSIKLNKFLQFFDPTSPSNPFANNTTFNFVLSSDPAAPLVVQLNTNKEVIDRLIKDSGVLAHKESANWDWDIVVLIFKTNLLLFLQNMDDNQHKFLRRLVDYFKPSNNRFSHQDLMLGRQVAMHVNAGVEMMDWYMRMYAVLDFLVRNHQHLNLNITSTYLAGIQSQYNECVRFLREFANDVHFHLDAILTARSAHDCLFSPQHMVSTMCQQYFLFVGRLCRNEFGVQVLHTSQIFATLEKIVKETNHISYIKLIVTALDYSQPCAVQARQILQLALTESKVLAGRLYATQFLLVLMRAQIANFAKWGLQLLIDQATQSANKSISLVALDILEEACHEEAYLQELILLWPPLDAESCGDAGKLVMTHFYSQVS